MGVAADVMEWEIENEPCTAASDDIEQLVPPASDNIVSAVTKTTISEIEPSSVVVISEPAVESTVSAAVSAAVSTIYSRLEAADVMESEIPNLPSTAASYDVAQLVPLRPRKN